MTRQLAPSKGLSLRAAAGVGASGPSAGLDSRRDRVRPFPSLDLFHLKMKELDGTPPKCHTVDRSAEGRLLEGQRKK